MTVMERTHSILLYYKNIFMNLFVNKPVLYFRLFPWNVFPDVELRVSVNFIFDSAFRSKNSRGRGCM